VALEVRRVLASSIPADNLEISDIATKLAMTPRTLQRRLADEGTSFDKLRDLTRKSAAEAYLADPTLSIGEVTYLLGYAEPTAFHRAFKRWHGTTPQRFREKHRRG
jgi:AraC-like DNA-binding protein